MNRMIPAFLCALMLTGCAGDQGGDMAVAGAVRTPEPVQPVAENVCQAERPDIVLKTEWPVYDPSVNWIWYTVENTGTETVEFGQPYAIERLEGEDWAPISDMEPAWHAIGYELAPGGKMALSCWAKTAGGLTEGDYRIVKPISNGVAAASFRVEAGAEITFQRPYGLSKLEDLPENAYLPGGADGTPYGPAVVYSMGETEKGELVETFLNKVALGIPCALRSVHSYQESWPLTIDVIYENDHFRWRQLSGGELTEQRFSYLVTDGADVYFSNGADWATTEKYDSDTAFLAPPSPGAGAAYVAAVDEMTAARLEGNTTRYKVWSANGEHWAALTEDSTEFSAGWNIPGKGVAEASHSLAGYDGPTLTAIRSIAWQEDGKLRLTCDTVQGGAFGLTWDPETETFDDGLRVCGLPLAEN